MKERGILFSAPMVLAIMSGLKTQTRRIVKDQNHMQDAPKSFPAYELDDGAGFGFGNEEYEWKSPYGNPGDRLWVRETWAWAGDNDFVVYRADYPKCVPVGYENIPDVSEMRWKPSIHMFRKHSRILLEITSVRIERLQEISEADAFAEGIDEDGEVFSLAQNILDNMGAAPPGSSHDIPDSSPAKAEFKHLWDSINFSRASWDENPFVWVVGFKRVTSVDDRL